MNLEEKKNYVLENIKYLPKVELDKYHDNFVYGFIKNSSCIEGDHITLPQVISLIESNKAPRESNIQRSVYNNYFAYKMIEKRAIDNIPFDEEFFKDVHERLMQDISVGGLYRNVDIKIKGSSYIPCTYLKIYDRMGKFIYELENFTGTPVELAAFVHLQIAKIHPFLDGNGRMARLFMNFELIRHQYLPIIINAKEKEEYFDALEEYKVNKNEKPFLNFVIKRLDKEYDRLIKLIDCYKN